MKIIKYSIKNNTEDQQNKMFILKKKKSTYLTHLSLDEPGKIEKAEPTKIK